MNLQLFQYQTDLINLIRQKINDGIKKIVAVLDTGGGKTYIFAAIAKAAQDKGNQVLILTDRLLLTDQSRESLFKAGCRIGVVNDGVMRAPVLLATVQTAMSRRQLLPTPKIVIIDEAHEGIFKKCLDWWPDAVYIGFTATPVYTSKKDPIKNYWQAAVCPITRPELIKSGRLVPLKISTTKLSLAGLRVMNTGEFCDASQIEVFKSPAIWDAMQADITARPQQKTVVFCPNVELTNMALSNLQSWGYAARAILGSTPPEERMATVAWLKNTPDAFLVNCMVATKGFDEPSLERAILMYATTSVTKYYQTVGRVCRSHPGKEAATVWDYGGNTERFWHPDTAVDWVGMFENAPKPGNGIAPIKVCEPCGAIVPASARACSFCGADFKVGEKDKKEATADELLMDDAAAMSTLSYETHQLTKAQNLDKIYSLLKDKAKSEGATAAKNMAQKAANAGVKNYKPSFWVFAGAKAVYEIFGEAGLDEAYPATNDFYMRVRETARNKKK